MKACHGSAMCFKCGCHVSQILTPEVAVSKGWHCPCAIDSPSHPISHHCTPGVHLQCWWSIWLCTHPVSLFSINRCHPINWITSLISTQEPKSKALSVTVQWCAMLCRWNWFDFLISPCCNAICIERWVWLFDIVLVACQFWCLLTIFPDLDNHKTVSKLSKLAR